jgi:hypothetical protein
MSPQSDRGRAERELHAIERKMAHWTMWVGIFTGCLVVTSLVGNLFIYLQYYTSANAQFDTREQLRAIVTNPLTTIAVPDDLEKPGFVAVVPNFQNFGGTRTHHFRGNINVKYYEGGIPNNIDLSKPYLNVAVQDTIIGPNSTYQMQVGLPVEDLKKAQTGAGQVLFWGNAEYSDIFEPKKIHHVSMCTLILPHEGADKKVAFQIVPYQPDCNRSD